MLFDECKVKHPTFLSNQMVHEESNGWLPLGSAGAGARATESDMTVVKLSRGETMECMRPKLAQPPLINRPKPLPRALAAYSREKLEPEHE
jgi:hypothetical protein